MSSSDPVVSTSSMFRRVAAALAVASALAVSACTVQPLYGGATASIAPGEPSARVASIAVKEAVPRTAAGLEVALRPAQEVRNHLIFGFNGGAGQPASPRYLMELEVLQRTTETATVQRSNDDNEPSAGAVRLTGTYRLVDPVTTEIVATGTRSATATFDRPVQLFAEARAERDAENRAARELAAFLQLAVMQDLARL
ncbi:LPS assembly lipoprotein LptE [Aquibium sp. ELW1220]|uniref:LPS assembly lipoprotein LptE n=1 Tax=Aquibium sp. ELW1220 TaxID=2976766 RepID=UPI0025B05C33|nr:LPS assembly lipoprotein LptE [Aquibium sp. ELW1220]MDN2582571.1 LPS assembly lipoprotein LptE [Aquibium sp. ELW1220]